MPMVKASLVGFKKLHGCVFFQAPPKGRNGFPIMILVEFNPPFSQSGVPLLKPPFCGFKRKPTGKPTILGVPPKNTTQPHVGGVTYIDLGICESSFRNGSESWSRMSTLPRSPVWMACKRALPHEKSILKRDASQKLLRAYHKVHATVDYVVLLLSLEIQDSTAALCPIHCQSRALYSRNLVIRNCLIGHHCSQEMQPTTCRQEFGHR